MKTLANVAGIVASLVLLVVGLVSGSLGLMAFAIALPFAVLSFTSPMLRRLAVRNATRRPRETLLILVGSLLGTAIVTSSGIVGDTFASSVRQTVHTQLGPIDEVIDLPADSANVVEQYFAKQPHPDVDGVLMITRSGGSVAVAGNDPRALSDVQVIEMPFDKARDFGGDPKVTGIDGNTPSAGAVAIGEDVADELDIAVGDTIDIYAFGQKSSLRIDRVLERKGLAGIGISSEESKSFNVFVAPGTLASLAKAQGRGGEPINTTLISNTGDVTSGAVLSNQVKKLIEDGPLAQTTRPPIGSDFDLGAGKPMPSDRFGYAAVEMVKEDRIKSSDEAGTVFRRLFIGIGSFTILAGVLLLINIFTMLAQERQSELGLLRAMGLRRRALVAAFSIEGFLYAIGSSLLGTIAGMAIGRIVVAVASGIFSTRLVGLDLQYAATFESIARGFVGGLGISMATVVIASLFIARMNVIRAIRELPDPGIQRRRLIGLLIGIVVIGIGKIITFTGLSTENEFAVLVGPTFIGIGTLMVLRRWIATKRVLTAVSVAILAWSVFAFTIAEKAFDGANAGVYVLQGVQLTAFAVALISANQEHIGNVLRIFGRGSWSMALRLGLAYPLARRGRTGLLIAMYSLVIFVLTFIITISHVLTTSVDKQIDAIARGADIRVSTTLEHESRSFTESRQDRATVPVADIGRNADVDRVAALVSSYQPVSVIVGDSSSFVDVLGFDANYAGNGAPETTSRDAAFPDDESLFRAVAERSDLLILRGNGGGIDRETVADVKVGDSVRIEGTETTRDFTVAAIVTNASEEVLVGRAALEALQGKGNVNVERALVKVKPGVDAVRLASQISGLYVNDRIEARTIKDVVAEGFSIVKQFLMLIQGYMAIGLLVGIAGLGVVMVRAVRERRRQIGMLRAMGFPSASVRRAFIAEAAFIAAEGILIGVALALVVLARTFAALPGEADLGLQVPWLQLLTLVAVTFAASLLAAAGPAQQASRIPPAVALRTTD